MAWFRQASLFSKWLRLVVIHLDALNLELCFSILGSSRTISKVCTLLCAVMRLVLLGLWSLFFIKEILHENSCENRFILISVAFCILSNNLPAQDSVTVSLLYNSETVTLVVDCLPNRPEDSQTCTRHSQGWVGATSIGGGLPYQPFDLQWIS